MIFVSVMIGVIPLRQRNILGIGQLGINLALFW